MPTRTNQWGDSAHHSCMQYWDLSYQVTWYAQEHHHTVTSIVSFLIETTVTVRSSEYGSHLKDTQTLWVRRPACGQGCQIGFFEAKFHKYVLFNLVGVTNFIWLFGFFLAFLRAKIICTKITYNPFSNSFSFKKNVFFISYIWQNFCRQESGQEGARHQPVSRLNTVDTWHVRGPSLQFVSDLRKVFGYGL